VRTHWPIVSPFASPTSFVDGISRSHVSLELLVPGEVDARPAELERATRFKTMSIWNLSDTMADTLGSTINLLPVYFLKVVETFPAPLQ
jgi:hypothetical protein